MRRCAFLDLRNKFVHIGPWKFIGLQLGIELPYAIRPYQQITSDVQFSLRHRGVKFIQVECKSKVTLAKLPRGVYHFDVGQLVEVGGEVTNIKYDLWHP